jgi:hypothetical protein
MSQSPHRGIVLSDCAALFPPNHANLQPPLRHSMRRSAYDHPAGSDPARNPPSHQAKLAAPSVATGANRTHAFSRTWPPVPQTWSCGAAHKTLYSSAGVTAPRPLNSIRPRQVPHGGVARRTVLLFCVSHGCLQRPVPRHGRTGKRKAAGWLREEAKRTRQCWRQHWRRESGGSSAPALKKKPQRAPRSRTDRR